MIPKRIIQVWLGGPMPNQIEEWVAAWKDPGWEYALITEKDITKDLICYECVMKSNNYAQMADYLRY